MQRKLNYLIKNRIIYRRDPIDDTPTEIFSWGKFYKKGTYNCYTLFQSKAKITTYRSLKWHGLVLWHLNPELSINKFTELMYFICNKDNGFISFNINKYNIKKIIKELDRIDIDKPPKNKLRKIIFNDNCGLDKIEKLKIVGSLIGRNKKASPELIYDAMLHINDLSEKITITKVASILNVSTRTIYRNINKTINKEKLTLNEEIQH
tara:strand:- start:3232 stop:3852 length:621 start_codon:yes stop_codon:yes gene_type:complete